MARRIRLSTALHKRPANHNDTASLAAGDTASAAKLPIATGRGRKAPKLQSIGTEQFFYFFLRLRKSEVRRVVQRVKSLYPGETPEKLARRLINTQSTLSFLGGALLYLPQLVPVAGSGLKFAGFAGGASVMTRMHLYLILEIALLYGHDIDDQARVAEMMSIVAASGIAAGSPFLVAALNWHRLAAIPTAGFTVLATTQIIGAAAIRHYSKAAKALGQSGAIPALTSA
jgi:hypothetical protein